MKGRLIVLGSLVWCLAWLAFALAVPSAYLAVSVGTVVLMFVMVRAPGIFTVNAMADYSGKGHRPNLPVGCLPITFALDLATAPAQLPFLFPMLAETSRTTLEGLKSRAAFLVPESLDDIIARTGPFDDLEPWECAALVEACKEGMIDDDAVPRLVAFFARERCGRAGQDALIRLVRRHRLEPGTLRRVFDAERQRGRFDRRSAVLEALAGNAGATPEFLRALRDLEAPGSHARTARMRLREMGEADG